MYLKIFRSLIKNYLREDRHDALRRHLRYVYRRYRSSTDRYRFEHKTPKQIFTEIYASGLWGTGDHADLFYSGSGSHDEHVTEPYIKAVSQFFLTLGRPDVVDIGCGDFAVGAKLCGFCRSYIAADIVEPLIVRNRVKYHDIDVDFRVIDITQTSLPKGDVLTVRQVFQHMSNADIAKSLENIVKSYRYLIITEHLPDHADFSPNLEKSAGSDIRLYGAEPSGVVLTSTPFNLPARTSRVLCEVAINDGVCPSVIRTILYEL